jgi:hypothetical protein
MSEIDYDTFQRTTPAPADYAHWRRQLLALLALERARLLGRLLGLDEATLSRQEIFADYPAVALLGHLAAWDQTYVEWLALALSGRTDEIVAPVPDERNAELLAEHRNWTVAQTVTALGDARTRLLARLAEAGDEQLHQGITLPWGDGIPLRAWALRRARHDALHRRDVERWRQKAQPERTIGPRALLYAALEASHQALLALVQLVPETQREERCVVEDWSVRDILGHVADWERYGSACLRADGTEEMEVRDVDVWNELHASGRRQDSFETVVADLAQSGAALRAALAERPLGMTLPHQWGRAITAYAWARGYVDHALEHVEMLQHALLTGVPRQP